MATATVPVTIKKYANRRLYNTGTSTYVTLEDLATMVKQGDDFVVFDAKTGEEITRSVLTQIIFEQEAKEGQNLLPVTFLRQLIRFYGDSLQSLVPRYLEFSIDRLSHDQQKMREQLAKAFGGGAFSGQSFTTLEDLTRHNMAMFSQALALFNPFLPQAAEASPPKAAEPASDLDELKRQMIEMQRRLDKLDDKS